MLTFCGHNNGRVEVICWGCSQQFMQIAKTVHLNCITCNNPIEAGYLPNFDLLALYCRNCDTYSILQGIKMEES